MKLLAADIGNTNLTLGLFDGESLVASWRATARPVATTDELAAQVAGLLALDGERLERIEAVAIASVVPPLAATFERMVHDRLALDPFLLDASTVRGALEIRIDRPAEAGADRLANALAVCREFPLPAIVVDLGTSTNFDVVSADGAYLGGAIAPGLGLSLEALAGRAAKLPRIELRRPPRAIGTTTVQAMQSGTVNGYIGLVSGLLAALRTELLEASPPASRVTVIATGGYTHEPWLRDVPGIDAIEPDLTLRGIRYAWQAAHAAVARTPAAERVAR
ncbi:MAG: type III pantothenate kinase [Chloroflexi bacterium]|nr:MAG: type III pantothenate kinase [Chloroflexota bacterium]